MQYWIMGAGGIGCALTSRCLELGHRVTLLSRARPEMRVDDWIEVDNTDAEALYRQTAGLSLPDRVINTVGMLHDERHQPEKRIEQLDEAALLASLHINTWPTLAMGQLLSRRLERQRPLLFAALSARVGSISDNRAGGWYSYRISKAALNMAIKTLAVEWRRRFPAACVVGLHPGTVATGLSAPFRSGLPAGQVRQPAEAVVDMLRVLDRLTPEQSGYLYALDGSQIQP